MIYKTNSKYNLAKNLKDNVCKMWRKFETLQNNSNIFEKIIGKFLEKLSWNSEKFSGDF